MSIATSATVLPYLLGVYNSIVGSREGSSLVPNQIIQIPCDRLTEFIFQRLTAVGALSVAESIG